MAVVIDCAIIIPVFNRVSLTRLCLEKVLAAVLGCERTVKVIVVDDGSSESFADLVADYSDTVEFIRHEQNRGFATVCNDAANAVPARYLVFLNNDTLPDQGWLNALLEYADEHPTAAVVGSKLLFPNGTVQHAGVVVCQDLYPRHLYAGFPGDHPAVNQSRRFQIVTAASALVRRDVFVEAGGFDKGFRNGYEDVDFCLRIGQLGYEVHYCHKSIVYHLESVSRDAFREAVDASNEELFRARWVHQLEPDDVRYYMMDGLLRFTYWEQYPATLEISPLLATIERPGFELERLLNLRARQVFELVKENMHLKLTNSPELAFGHVPDESVRSSDS